MKWDEFRDFLVGIGPDTSLGRIVSIRAENDKEALKHFSREQRRIRNEWRKKCAKSKSPSEIAGALDGMKNAFIAMAGGGERI